MKFILKNLLLSSLVAFALASDEESQQLRGNSQIDAQNVRRTQSGGIGLCRSDCDRDSDCQAGLVCHQRDAGDDAPGCSLSSSQRSSRADFCVRSGGSPSPPSPAASPVRAPPTGGSSGKGFALKLYWEDGKTI